MIHIAYGIEDLTGDFYEYLGLSMFSVMKNTNEE